ncbi:nucleolar complex-associated protein-domain-containing protein [Mycena albidolilacea]|uniref:Nucleolar complex-associated protein 3 n=1 Tax=Mycena albidolilacea TaxID=1033008 RepID=A0AAD7EQW6_9AGAR|nr:nucleolar complex-associated protein-domain-containing protein [Mycena albidolilacea]
MAPKTGAKRSAPPTLAPSKRRKLAAPAQKNKPADGPKKYIIKPKEKGKEKAADRGTIPIPSYADDEELELSDQDLDVLEEYGGATSFLNSLDQTAISRSKKETERLRQLNKPARKAPEKDDLPSLESHDEDEGDWSSDLLSDDNSLPDDDSDGSIPSSDMDSDAEMPYEAAPRKRRPSWEAPPDQGIQKLPIKLPDGRIQKTGTKLKQLPTSEDTEESEDEDEEVPEEPRREDVSTGARFGRPAVVDVVGNKSRAARLQGAKDQIASICQEIMADPENSLGLLRRLHTFSLAEISTPSHPDPVANDVIIRKLAILSQLAVFKDIIPGYRIRALTEKEKTEKVSQMVSRTRDWEQGLVVVYQTYLRALEGELKAKSDLADISLRAMCTLVTELTHFNFRGNLMSCIVARLSKKSWDKSSDQCLDAIIKVFRADLTGEASLEVVRLLNRMVKERRFNIHPTVLSCLLHLRLKTELGVRASESHTDKPEPVKRNSYGKDAARRAKGKPTAQPHLSKKARKALKEKKEIDREFRDAEAEVDKEERAVTHTETLKLLFVLYFRIIKNPRPTPLLPAALQGISKYAHLVNIDFFKDLLKVLKELVAREVDDDDEDTAKDASKDVQQRLQCIVTAFELLSGQGEALNIDLSDFISALYALILPLSFVDPGTGPADMLFRALNIVFSPRTFGAAAPPWRAAAFAKRLLTAALHWPPAVALRALEFVGGLLAKDPTLAALLSTEERALDGAYRPDVDDPQLCNPLGTCFWELVALSGQHWDPRVRVEAQKVMTATRE